MMSILSFLFSLFLTFVVLIVALVLIGFSRMRAMLGGKNPRNQYQQTGGRNPFGSQEGASQGGQRDHQNRDRQQRQQSNQGDNRQPNSPHKKVFSQGEGEYVDFEEVEE